MNLKELENKITRDVAVELHEEFDRNFERKAFFTEKWPQTKWPNSKGSLMMRSGKSRRSIRYSVAQNQILFSSSLSWLSIHNEGGTITVTPKMKKFFWAMYYKASGAVTKTKGGTVAKNQRNTRLSAEAMQWKNMALMKVGHVMKIPKRQIVGDHPYLDKPIKAAIDHNLELYSDELAKQFKP